MSAKTEANTVAKTDESVKRETKNVNISVDIETYNALNEIRFERRHNRLGDAGREAIVEYVAKYSK